MTSLGMPFLDDLGDLLDLAAAEQRRRPRVADGDDRRMHQVEIDGARKADGLVAPRLGERVSRGRFCAASSSVRMDAAAPAR